MSKKEDRAGEIFVAAVLSSCLLYGAALLAYGAVSGDVPSGTKPSLTDWISALSTLVAFAVASVAVGVAWRALGLERERDRHRDEREMRAQAENVAAWAEIIHNTNIELVPGNAEGAGPTIGFSPSVPESIVATVRNATRLPVNALQLHLHVLSDDSDSTSEPIRVASVHIGQVLEGDWGPQELLTPPLAALLTSVSSCRESAEIPMTVMIGWSFQDNAGVWWVRTPKKRLEEGTVPLDPAITFFPPGVDAVAVVDG